MIEMGRVLDSKLEIIPTANRGFIVKFGREGRLAFEGRRALLNGLEDYLNNVALYRIHSAPLNMRKEEE